MPRGERFYYRHKRKVVDGTTCEEDKLDICVDGKCLVNIPSLLEHNILNDNYQDVDAGALNL